MGLGSFLSHLRHPHGRGCAEHPHSNLDIGFVLVASLGMPQVPSDDLSSRNLLAKSVRLILYDNLRPDSSSGVGQLSTTARTQ